MHFHRHQHYHLPKGFWVYLAAVAYLIAGFFLGLIANADTGVTDTIVLDSNFQQRTPKD